MDIVGLSNVRHLQMVLDCPAGVMAECAVATFVGPQVQMSAQNMIAYLEEMY